MVAAPAALDRPALYRPVRRAGRSARRHVGRAFAVGQLPLADALAPRGAATLVRAVGRGLGQRGPSQGGRCRSRPDHQPAPQPLRRPAFRGVQRRPRSHPELAVEYVRGIQEYGVGATVKHYVANDSETDRFTVDVAVDERVLRELYLLAFERPVVDGRRGSVMSAYNSINGSTASENALLDVRSTTNGASTASWSATGRRCDRSRARAPAGSRHARAHGGMGRGPVRAVLDGEVPEAAIDRKVVRISGSPRGWVRSRDPAERDAESRPGPARDAGSRRRAREWCCSNDGVLPLGVPATIAVIGEGGRRRTDPGRGQRDRHPRIGRHPRRRPASRWPDAAIVWARGAVVDRRPSPRLALDTMTDADGRPGLTVRYWTRPARSWRARTEQRPARVVRRRIDDDGVRQGRDGLPVTPQTSWMTEASRSP